jgi:hypothetical protein
VVPPSHLTVIVQQRVPVCLTLCRPTRAPLFAVSAPPVNPSPHCSVVDSLIDIAQNWPLVVLAFQVPPNNVMAVLTVKSIAPVKLAIVRPTLQAKIAVCLWALHHACTSLARVYSLVFLFRCAAGCGRGEVREGDPTKECDSGPTFPSSSFCNQQCKCMNGASNITTKSNMLSVHSSM